MYIMVLSLCVLNRGQEHCVDRETPDSYVPSSSPESVVGMEISRYPDLSRVKEEPPSPAVSPVIPILCSASGKGNLKRVIRKTSKYLVSYLLR